MFPHRRRRRLDIKQSHITMPQPVPSSDTSPKPQAYDAPPVLLARTGQADRDNAHAQAGMEQRSAEMHVAFVGQAGVPRADVAGPIGGGARP